MKSSFLAVSALFLIFAEFPSKSAGTGQIVAEGDGKRRKRAERRYCQVCHFDHFCSKPALNQEAKAVLTMANFSETDRNPKETHRLSLIPGA